MSSFDKRVCQWLNSAAISDRSKQTILHRMNVGISNYRSLEIERVVPAHAASKSANSSAASGGESRIDYSLQDMIAKALYRLEDGDHGSASEPLFPVQVSEVPKFAPSMVPAIAARSTSNHNIQSDLSRPPQDQPFTEPSASGMDGFTFGEAPPEQPFSSSTPAQEDDGDNIDAGEIDEKEVEELRRRMVKRQSRNAVSAEPINIADARHFHVTVIHKSPDVVKRVIATLENHQLFAHLEDGDIVDAAQAMDSQQYRRGVQVALKGQSNDRMYLVVAGSVVALGTGERINVGGTFGDVGLMYDVQNADTYETTMNSTQLCSIDRITYQSLCSRSSQEKRERYASFLANVKTLEKLTPQERLQLADALKTSKYAKGENIISYGDEGRWFFLIVEGTVDVIGRDEKGQPVNVCSFTTGHSLGELELLHKHKAVADCVAASNEVKVAKMTGRHFEKVIGSAKEFLERQAANDEVYQYYRHTRKTSSS